MAVWTAAQLAHRFELTLRGDGQTEVTGVCTLTPGHPGRLSFLANPKYRSALADTAASVVVVGVRDAETVRGTALVARDPYLAFARISALFDVQPACVPGIHPTAVVDATARVDPDAEIGPLVVIDAGATIGAGARIAAHSHVGLNVVIGEGTRLEGRNWIGPNCIVGARCRLNAGCVIGARGFGLAPTPDGWEEVPQLGRVVIGDDVEIGANACVDRGAIDDTVIESGAKLDDLVMVAHNCRIGARTAIAAQTGMAGSTNIGARCLIGGAVGISGHLTIGDDVVLLGRSMVTHSLPEKGTYGSGWPVVPAREWRKQVARMRRLDRTEAKIKRLEARLGLESAPEQEGEPT
ncbi:UDP-3-O-(3-hydroxymyristoyl)glucosamine N-acyltransferase [Polycyclovorans algicola]|uniref:UDP-3-O-(3-hydroxymyristoyl)glucosamine N-acyltransferase n=1 Tax=Polycyclovorans algicola TaxID=616992 RepID=UPI0004A6AC86|nr:UDP-3-O-(3-hydroxymyristoyl)glucosamine N-acyltransferase [Polycyclovorans algicola]